MKFDAPEKPKNKMGLKKCVVGNLQALQTFRDKRMALRDGIDTDYDEGDQFEEETVRLMFMSKLDVSYDLIFN